LYGSNQGDTFNVLGTLTGSTTTLNGGTGNDTFNVGDATHDLDNLAGNLVVNGGGGTDALTVNDTANTNSVGWGITADTIARIGAGSITYQGLGSANVENGSGNDAFVVGSTASGTPLTLTLGRGSNNVTVGGSLGGRTLDGIQSALSLAGNTAGAVVTVDDADNPSTADYTVSDGGVNRSGAAGISFASPVSALTVLGGTGNSNAFDVTPSAATTINVDGGTGADNTLTVETGGAAYTDDGSAITVAGKEPINYTDFANKIFNGP
jgi:hypothetical protein